MPDEFVSIVEAGGAIRGLDARLVPQEYGGGASSTGRLHPMSIHIQKGLGQRRRIPHQYQLNAMTRLCVDTEDIMIEVRSDRQRSKPAFAFFIVGDSD